MDIISTLNAAAPMFSCIMQNIEDALLSDDKTVMLEPRVLALGAVAAGCNSFPKNRAYTLLPEVVKLLKHPSDQLRATSCWTCSRRAYTLYCFLIS